MMTYHHLNCLTRSSVVRWKDIYVHKSAPQRPKTCASALEECDSNLYTNLSVLLRIACTLSVTSSECERCTSTTQLRVCWDDRESIHILGVDAHSLPAPR